MQSNEVVFQPDWMLGGFGPALWALGFIMVIGAIVSLSQFGKGDK